MLLVLFMIYAFGTYAVWVWRLTVDVSRGEAAFLSGILLLTSGLGGLRLASQLHSMHAALVSFGTLYACALLVTRGRPARMLEYRGRPYTGTIKQTRRHQLAFCALFIPAVVAFLWGAHRY